MTMLNGEPVDSGVPSTGSSPKTVGAQPGSPPVDFRGTPTVTAQGVDPSNRSIAKILAIVGLILAFTAPPFGILLGGIAGAMLKPERSAIASWAVIVGIICTILTVLVTIGFFVFLWWTTSTAVCIGGVSDLPFCN
jgi:hypothetical protein